METGEGKSLVLLPLPAWLHNDGLFIAGRDIPENGTGGKIGSASPGGCPFPLCILNCTCTGHL
jgi:hypothetical protein